MVFAGIIISYIIVLLDYFFSDSYDTYGVIYGICNLLDYFFSDIYGVIYGICNLK